MPSPLLLLCLLAPAPAPSPTPASTSPSDAAPPPDAAPADDAGASEKEVTRYQFTGLDIEGELRTPALLQFLARIAGEFETLGIPHRSFLPELAATVTEDVL